MDLDLVTSRVREEFREMPGLRLTPAQATRLVRLCQRAAGRARKWISALPACSRFHYGMGVLLKYS